MPLGLFLYLTDDYLLLRISKEGVEKTPTQTNLGQFPLGSGRQEVQI